MERTLLLNTTLEPLNILSGRKAVIGLFLENRDKPRKSEREEIRGVSNNIRHLADTRPVSFVPFNHAYLTSFTRRIFFLRDKCTFRPCDRGPHFISRTVSTLFPNREGK